MSVTKTAAPQKKPFYKVLYVQVLAAIALGAIVGWLFPEFAKNDWIKAMGDGFVKLIKMLIAPIIFCTVVSGIAHISEVKKVGRVAVKALIYFEIVSTFALALGLIVANVLRPGAGFQGQSNAAAVAGYAKQASETKSVDFVLHIIPDTVVGAFAQGEILQVLLFAILFGFALMALGLIVANVLRPGAGFQGQSNATAVAGYARQASEMKSVDFVLHIIPDTVVGAFAQGDILQVLLFSILFGFALMTLGERGHTIRGFIDDAAHAIFGVIAIVVKAAPIGAFGAMAYTIGRYGPQALGNLAGLIATFYLTSIVFVVVVLGIVARIAGFSIFRFLKYIKDELLIVLGTSSSESALPQLMEKLERLGCSKPVVGLVVPTGYSFNLDGTNI